MSATTAKKRNFRWTKKSSGTTVKKSGATKAKRPNTTTAKKSSGTTVKKPGTTKAQNTKKKSIVSRAISYNRDVRNAHRYGYRDGYAAYDHIANTGGARTAAKHGYGRGLSAHNKVNKYQEKAKR